MNQKQKLALAMAELYRVKTYVRNMTEELIGKASDNRCGPVFSDVYMNVATDLRGLEESMDASIQEVQ